MNDLQIFKNSEFGQVRTFTEENGSITFCGADAAKALGYENTRKAIIDHCKEDGVTIRATIDSMGRTQQAKFISEGNLYRLIAGSRLPDAEKFESWIFDEVIPSVRKTGGYVNNDELFINTYFANIDEGAKAVFRQTLKTLRAANTQIEQDRPKVTFANAVTASKTSILVGELAKILKQNGIDTGERRLFDWMRKHGYLIRRSGTDYNAPTQRSMEMGLFEVKESTIHHNDGSVTVTRTTKVTGKGQQYFTNLFLRGK